MMAWNGREIAVKLVKHEHDRVLKEAAMDQDAGVVERALHRMHGQATPRTCGKHIKPKSFKATHQ
jgi:hypothetical protein